MNAKEARLWTKLWTPRTPTPWKIVCVVVTAALSTSCAAKQPAWTPRLFFGDQSREGLTRNGNDPDFISCRDPKDKLRYDQMICMRPADLKSALDIMSQCKDWGQPRPGTIMVTPEEFMELLTGRPASP